MASEDTDNARLGPPPLPPVPAEQLTASRLGELADAVAAATWRLGLRRWFWGEGVCLTGLVQSGLAAHGVVPEAVLDWYDAHLLGGTPPSGGLDHVNEVAPGAAAVDLVAHAGRTAYLPELRRLADWTSGPGVSTAPNGAIEHWPGGVWADTMTMVGTFLVRLGAVTRDAELAERGAGQVLAHAEILQAGNGLFVHGSHRGEVIPCYWGRANAWAALAMVEVLDAGPVVGAAHDPVRDRLGRQLSALVDLQPEHGVWDVLVDSQVENAGLLECSATAGLGAALLRAGPLLGDPGLTAAGWRALAGVLAYLGPDGLLTRVSAGTVLQLVPFGYSVIRDDRPQPWGQGLLLTALAAGMEDLARRETGSVAPRPPQRRPGPP